MKTSPILRLPSPIKGQRVKSLIRSKQINIGIQVFLEEITASAKNKAVINTIGNKTSLVSERSKEIATYKETDTATTVNIKPCSVIFRKEKISLFAGLNDICEVSCIVFGRYEFG